LAAVGLAPAAHVGSEEGAQIEDHKSLEMALTDEQSDRSTPESVSPWLEAQQPEEPQLAEAQVEQSQVEEPRLEVVDMTSPWSESPDGWGVGAPAILGEVPFQPDVETSTVNSNAVSTAEAATVEEATSVTEAVDVEETVGAKDAFSEEEVVGEEETVAAGTTDRPPAADDMTARAKPSDDSLSSLHGRVRTAKELMALPPRERPDMLAFLEPPELARVVETSDDRGLKKSVIDVLENLGSSGSLDVLRRCLDDPDQEIQLYALDAADRLLGKE
jgi:hypothetical protein